LTLGLHASHEAVKNDEIKLLFFPFHVVKHYIISFLKVEDTGFGKIDFMDFSDFNQKN